MSQDGKEQLGSKCVNTPMKGESESVTLGLKGKGLLLGRGGEESLTTRLVKNKREREREMTLPPFTEKEQIVSCEVISVCGACDGGQRAPAHTAPAQQSSGMWAALRIT